LSVVWNSIEIEEKIIYFPFKIFNWDSPVLKLNGNILKNHRYPLEKETILTYTQISNWRKKRIIKKEMKKKRRWRNPKIPHDEYNQCYCYIDYIIYPKKIFIMIHQKNYFDLNKRMKLFYSSLQFNSGNKIFIFWDCFLFNEIFINTKHFILFSFYS
jgi:hypothetical protein